MTQDTPELVELSSGGHPIGRDAPRREGTGRCRALEWSGDRLRQPRPDLQGGRPGGGRAAGPGPARPAGEVIAIVGASGSGKSTLLSILGGLDVPSAGRAVVAGHDLAQMGRGERTRYRREVVGFVWQQTARNLLPYLSALENVELPMTLSGRRRPARPEPGPRAARPRRPGRAARPSPRSPLGRRAAAGRDRRGAGQRAGRPAGRRADRRARQHDVGRGLRAPAARQRGARHDHRHRDPRPARAEHVARTVAIRDGRTSSETVRRTERATRAITG